MYDTNNTNKKANESLNALIASQIETIATLKQSTPIIIVVT